MNKYKGHSHVPKIKKGTYQIGGTMTGRMQCKNPNYATKPATKPTWKTRQIIFLNGAVVSKGYNSMSYREIELAMMRDLAMGHPAPRRREAIEHTHRKLGLL